MIRIQCKHIQLYCLIDEWLKIRNVIRRNQELNIQSWCFKSILLKWPVFILKQACKVTVEKTKYLSKDDQLGIQHGFIVRKANGPFYVHNSIGRIYAVYLWPLTRRYFETWREMLAILWSLGISQPLGLIFGIVQFAFCQERLKDFACVYLWAEWPRISLGWVDRSVVDGDNVRDDFSEDTLGW